MSLTIQGLLVLVLGKVLSWAGLEASNEALQGWVSTTISLIGALVVYYGRYRQGDIKWWGGKK